MVEDVSVSVEIFFVIAIASSVPLDTDNAFASITSVPSDLIFN